MGLWAQSAHKIVDWNYPWKCNRNKVKPKPNTSTRSLHPGVVCTSGVVVEVYYMSPLRLFANCFVSLMNLILNSAASFNIPLLQAPIYTYRTRCHLLSIRHRQWCCKKKKSPADLVRLPPAFCWARILICTYIFNLPESVAVKYPAVWNQRFPETSSHLM